MRILVTGARGMLGTQVCKLAKAAGYEVLPTDIVGGSAMVLDVTNTAEVAKTFSQFEPECVIHCAAMTDVDGCTKEPETAFKLNAFATRNLAAACSSVNASLVYVSTDYVFDGEKGSAYTEYDAVNPISAYGESKLAGEIAVKELLNKFYIVRTSWVFAPYAKNFALSILNACETKKELTVVDDQIGSPTYAKDLAGFLVDTAGSPLYGTYHYTNSGSCSWYEFAKCILETAGITDVTIKPIKTEDWPTPTKRPKHSVLRHLTLEFLGKDNARPWQEAVSEFIKEWNTAKQ